MTRLLIVLIVLALNTVAPSAAYAGKAFEAEHTSGRMLLDYLDHPDWRFRLDATDEIADRKIAQAKPKLEELASSDPSDRVRRAALDALMDEFGGPSDRSVLHAILLEAGDENLRYDIVRMIESAPSRDDRDALIEALNDRNPHVARHAARALVRVGDRSVAPILRSKALDATDRKVAEEFNVAASRLGG
jgi:HEAT repeat protein